MAKLVIGEKRHQLTLLRIIGTPKGQRDILECECDCGKVTRIRRGKWGYTKTCGCRNVAKYWKGHGEISHGKWATYVDNAKKRGLAFDLTIEEAWQKFLDQGRCCNLTGTPIHFPTRGRHGGTASLDRIDSTQPYTLANTQWVHKDINRLKMDLNKGQLLEFAKMLLGHNEPSVQIESDLKLDFQDVLIRPQRSSVNSRADVLLTTDLKCPASGVTLTNVLPIMASNMVTVGSFGVAKALAKHRLMTCLHKHYDPTELVAFFDELTDAKRSLIFVSVGCNSDELDRLWEVLDRTSVTGVCLDAANGYTDKFFDAIKQIRSRYPSVVLMAGSVCTRDVLKEMRDEGVDIVRLGIGSGACCTTRPITGVGYPQLSCILDVYEEAAKLELLLCSDGGITVPGDAAKAFGAGATIVMVGSIFAGHEECEGDWEYDENGSKVEMLHYGMASLEAQRRFNGGMKSYRAPEGKAVKIPYRGQIANTVQELLGGLRSTATYVGSSRLDELSSHVRFIRSTTQENKWLNRFTTD